MKQAVIKGEPPFLVSPPASFEETPDQGTRLTGFRLLKEKLSAAMERLAPTGYQDETGYHAGEQPPPEEHD